MASISVVINTFNAQRVLRECLLALDKADEIIVCDMYSTDETVPIALEFGCKIIYYERSGYAEIARNWAHAQISSDWLLVVDADEIVPEKLWQYLKAFTENKEGFTTLCFPKQDYVLGKPLRCMYRRIDKRFWKKGCATYETHVHGGVLTLQGKDFIVNPKNRDMALLHYHVDSLDSYLEKVNRYTTLEQARFVEKNKKFSLAVFSSCW
jgi:glycosyltransferase involved in cell wall biosynthesis